MPTPDQNKLEEIRVAVLRHLYERRAVAQTAETIHRALKRETPCQQNDILNALTLWIGFDPPCIQKHKHPVGATESFQITSQGVLFFERQLA